MLLYMLLLDMLLYMVLRDMVLQDMLLLDMPRDRTAGHAAGHTTEHTIEHTRTKRCPQTKSDLIKHLSEVAVEVGEVHATAIRREVVNRLLVQVVEVTTATRPRNLEGWIGQRVPAATNRKCDSGTFCRLITKCALHGAQHHAAHIFCSVWRFCCLARASACSFSSRRIVYS